MKPDYKRKEGRSVRRVECLDAVNRHRANANVLAGLLEYSDAEKIDGELVVEAGGMIRRELGKVLAWTQRLEEAIRQ